MLPQNLRNNNLFFYLPFLITLMTLASAMDQLSPKDLPKKNPVSLRACALVSIASKQFDKLGKRSFYENLPNKVGEDILSLYYGLVAYAIEEEHDVWNDQTVNLSKNLFANEHVFMAAHQLTTRCDTLSLISSVFYRDVLYKPAILPRVIEISVTHEETFNFFYDNTKNYGTPEALALVEAAYKKYYADKS